MCRSKCWKMTFNCSSILVHFSIYYISRSKMKIENRLLWFVTFSEISIDTYWRMYQVANLSRCLRLRMRGITEFVTREFRVEVEMSAFTREFNWSQLFVLISLWQTDQLGRAVFQTNVIMTVQRSWRQSKKNGFFFKLGLRWKKLVYLENAMFFKNSLRSKFVKESCGRIN